MIKTESTRDAGYNQNSELFLPKEESKTFKVYANDIGEKEGSKRNS